MLMDHQLQILLELLVLLYVEWKGRVGKGSSEIDVRLQLEG